MYWVTSIVFQIMFDVLDDETTLSTRPMVVLLRRDPHTHSKDLGVSFDKKIRWKISPTDDATGTRDVFVRANLYTYAMSFLRMYHIDHTDEDRYRVTLDAYWNFWEM